MNKMKKMVFWLALTVPAFALAQPQTELFRSVFDTLNRKSQTAYFGKMSGVPNGFAEDFTRLSWNFSDADLAYIARTANPLMKASAGKELVRRKSPEIRSLFTDELHSPDRITVCSGELRSDCPLAVSLYQDVALQKEVMERKAYYQRTSTPEQLRGLKTLFGDDFDSKWSVAESDSLMAALTGIVFADDNASAETLSHICRINQFKCTGYARVKKFAVQFPTPELLATLASFRNRNDVAWIKSHFPDALPAISIFPHPAFLPLLKSRLEADYGNPAYQQAVAAYKSADSKLLLQHIFKKIATSGQTDARDQQLFALRALLEKADCPLYSDLITQLEKTI
jgi:hypothetical protein